MTSNSSNFSNQNNPDTTRNSNVPPQNPAQVTSNPDDRPSTSTGIRSFQTYTAQVDCIPNSTVILGNAICEVGTKDFLSSTRALIDPCSQATFITKRLQKRLCIPTFSTQMAEISGIHETVSATSSKRCLLSIGSPIDPNFKIQTEAYVVEKLTGSLPSCSLTNAINHSFPDITMADISSSRMDLLLGGEVYPHIILPDVRKHPKGNLVAQKTVFGWIVTGKVGQPEPLQSVTSFFNHVELNDQLSRFWELEEVPPVSRTTETEDYCEKLYRSTTYRNSDGRYVVSLPFKPDFP